MVLWEVLWERAAAGETQAVLRFLVPDLATLDPDAAGADLDWLCKTHAVPVSALPYARSDSVVVTLADRPVPRGATDPEAVQYFAAYRISDGTCVSEEY